MTVFKSSTVPKIPLDREQAENYGKGFRGPWPNTRPQAQPRMTPDSSPQWDRILYALPTAWLILDQRGVVCACNEAALKLLGRAETELVEHALLQVFPDWQATPFGEALSTLVSGEASSPVMEFDLLVSPDRSLRIVSCVPPVDAGREPVFVLSLSDLTELNKLKQRLKWTEYQASIGKLARGIAHELNNPLDGVSRYTHLALEQLREDTPVREYLIHVKEGLDRMVRAVRAFLEFSRQAVMPVNRTADANHLIDDGLVLFKHRATFQHVRIVPAFDPALPPVPDGGLQHAIVNLIKNAFDAMPRGGTLTLRTRVVNGSVEIQVQDTGSGIPEDIQPRVFEPFFSTKPIHQGSGLGLIIAKEVVDRSGGSISFTTEIGVGTTFTIRIPLTQGEA